MRYLTQEGCRDVNQSQIQGSGGHLCTRRSRRRLVKSPLQATTTKSYSYRICIHRSQTPCGLSQRSAKYLAASPRIGTMSREGEHVTEEVASTSSRVVKIHLALFVNGLNGNNNNWSVVIANLRKHAAIDNVAILASTANMSLQVLIVILASCVPTNASSSMIHPDAGTGPTTERSSTWDTPP